MQMRKLKQKIFYIQPPINAYKNANQFLHSFKEYVKIDVSRWGRTFSLCSEWRSKEAVLL